MNLNAWAYLSLLVAIYAPFPCSGVSVPVIDIGALAGLRQKHVASASAADGTAGGGMSSEVMDAVERIDHALRTTGCFVAINSRVGQAVSSGAFSASASLFGLGADTLTASAIPKGGFMRGYLPFGRESGLSSYFEPKEGFSYGYEWGTSSSSNGDADVSQQDNNEDEEEEAKTNALHGDNVWPPALDAPHREGLRSLFTSEVETAEDLATAIFLSLRQRNNATDFDTFLDDKGKTSVMRLFHYLARDALNIGDEVDNKAVMGSSPHTDWGFLTLILQDDVGGLQFKYKDQWIDVPHIPDSLIVNCGDFLQVISGGRYHSPVHRVISPRLRDRTSFVLFYYPRFETPMDPQLFERIHIATSSSSLGNNRDEEQSTASEEVSGGEAHNSLFRLVDSSSSSGGRNTVVKIEADGDSTSESRVDQASERIDSSSSGSNKVPCFGEYIIEKWREVKAY